MRVKGSSERSHRGDSQQLDKNGVVRLRGIPLGACEVQLLQKVSEPGALPQSVVALSKDIVVVKGSNRLQIAYPGLHDLEVIAPQERHQMMVNLTKEPSQPGDQYDFLPSAVLDQDHHAVLKGVPAGTYRVRAGRSQLVVTVPCGPVTLER